MALAFSKASGQKVKEQYDSYLEDEGKEDAVSEMDDEPCMPALEDIPKDHRCGYGPCKPTCTQRCNTSGYLLMCVCWFTFAQGFVVNGIINVNMSTIERRFELSTSEVAWISVTYDLMAGAVGLFFGYMGGFMHNGIMLSTGAYFMAMGSIVMFLPYLTAGVYDMGLLTSDLCELSNDTVREDCSAKDPNLSNNLYIFIIGQLFHAVGGSAVYTLAVPYMDNAILIKNTPIYIGTMYGFAALGPATGFILGGYFLTIYVDFARVDMDEVNLEPDDPRWVGAWWIGYLMAAGLSTVAGMLMCLWPRELPSAVVYRKHRENMAYKDKGEEESTTMSCKDICNSMKTLCTNPIWILNTIAGTASSGLVVAFATFLPKLMQSQFALTSGQAALSAGIVVVPGAVGGYILGGVIPRCCNLKLRGLLGQPFLCSVGAMCLSFIYLIYCETTGIAGVNVEYFDKYTEVETVDLGHYCHDHCNCTTSTYDPVCGSDGIQYFTPCHGGCMSMESDDEGNELFFNCSCVNTTTEYNHMAMSGVCDEDCTKELVIFLMLFLLIMLCSFVGSTAGQAATLRCIPNKERSFALGVQALFVRYFGNVPAPLIFGLMFDQSCMVWQESCGSTGSCWIYDSNALAWGMSWSTFVVSTICATCYFIGLCVYRPPAETEDDLEMEVEKDEKIVGGEVAEKYGVPTDEATRGDHAWNGNLNGGFDTVSPGDLSTKL